MEDLRPDPRASRRWGASERRARRRALDEWRKRGTRPAGGYDDVMEPPAETPTSPVTDAVLERVVEQAAELLHASRVGLAVIEPDANLDVASPALRFVAMRGMSAQFPQTMRPLHWRDGTTPTAISERRPVWSEDVLNDPAIDLTPTTRRNIQAEGYRGVLSVPLL